MYDDENLKSKYKIEVKISLDKLKAFLQISEDENGLPLTQENILSILKNNGVTYGIKEEVIKEITNNPLIKTDILVAEGKPAVNGINGRVIYHFDISKKSVPKILEDGRVDFKQLENVINVKKGDMLVSIIPPTEGEDGITVTGKIIKAQSGKKAKISLGKNVELIEDKNYVIAKADGQVTFVGDKLSVLEVFEVNNVDINTGNIDFVGNVVVKGDVKSGFSIKAGGKIDVLGVVEGAILEAEGDIVIKNGIQGQGKALIKTKGNLITKYMEYCQVEVGGNIATDLIIYSNVKCTKKVEVTGKNGLIIGGTIVAGEEILAKKVGSEMSTFTDLEVGVDPKTVDRYKDTISEFNKIKRDVEKLDQFIDYCNRIGINNLSEDKKELYIKTVSTKKALSEKLAEIEEELSELQEIIDSSNNGRIKISDIAYAGTRIIISNSMYFVKSPIRFATFIKEGGEIRVLPYK